MDQRALPEIDEGTTQRLVALFSSPGWATLVADGRTLLGHSPEEAIAYLTETPAKVAGLYLLLEAAKVYRDKTDSLSAFLEAIGDRANEVIRELATTFPSMGSRPDSFPRIDCGDVGHA